jgi:hypothetical protein
MFTDYFRYHYYGKDHRQIFTAPQQSEGVGPGQTNHQHTKATKLQPFPLSCSQQQDSLIIPIKARRPVIDGTVDHEDFTAPRYFEW